MLRVSKTCLVALSCLWFIGSASRALESPVIAPAAGPVSSAATLVDSIGKAGVMMIEAASSCTVEATCWDGSTVSCSDATSPYECLGENHRCYIDPSLRGWVQCNGGSVIYCPACPCEDGAFCTSSDDCGPYGACHQDPPGKPGFCICK